MYVNGTGGLHMDSAKSMAKKRILLKISGEAFSKGTNETYNFEILKDFAKTIKKCTGSGVQIGIVSGAGNIWRGRQGHDMDAARADHMGMIATVINSLAICDFLEQVGVSAKVLCSVPMGGFCEGYSKERAERAFEEGKVVIFAGGSGNPFFSTDTAAVLRAAEIGADMVLFAKNVSYIYNRDPNIKSDEPLFKYKQLSFSDILAKKLTAIDITATAFCMANNITIHVFGLDDMDNIIRTINGESVGTVVCGADSIVLAE